MQSAFCYKLFQVALESSSNGLGKLLWVVKALEEIWYWYFQVPPQEDDEWNSKWRKTILWLLPKMVLLIIHWGKRLQKNIFVCERHYEDQLIKCVNKIITSLLQEKSLQVSCKSEGQPNYILSSGVSYTLSLSASKWYCKNNSIRYDKMLRRY